MKFLCLCVAFILVITGRITATPTEDVELSETIKILQVNYLTDIHNTL